MFPCFAAFPCATQNELNPADAQAPDQAEWLQMRGRRREHTPSTLEAAHDFVSSGIAYGPAKAANAGGVATSQLLEMAQNAEMQSWTFEEVDKKAQANNG